jgi:hypothetical protein
MSRVATRLERCLCRVIWVLLIQERGTLSSPPPGRRGGEERYCFHSDEREQKDDKSRDLPRAPSETLECCVCYEVRAEKPVPFCPQCGSQAPVCKACLKAWSLSTGLRKSCVICRSQGSAPERSHPARDEQEEYLTIFFLTYTCFQYLYIIWFLRTFVCTAQSYLF